MNPPTFEARDRVWLCVALLQLGKHEQRRLLLGELAPQVDRLFALVKQLVGILDVVIVLPLQGQHLLPARFGGGPVDVLAGIRFYPECVDHLAV